MKITILKFIDSLKKLQVDEMDEDTTVFFTAMLMNEINQPFDLSDKDKLRKWEKDFGLANMIMNLKTPKFTGINVKFSIRVVMVIWVCFKGNPANVAMWSLMTAYEAFKRGETEVGMMNVAKVYSPNGFWKSETTREVWESQKEDGKNLLDDIEFYRPLQEKVKKK